MNIGMMWLDASQLDLATKIKKAMDYYVKKYGLTPNKAFVNPKAWEEVVVEGVAIVPDRYILPKQIWIGVEE